MTASVMQNWETFEKIKIQYTRKILFDYTFDFFVFELLQKHMLIRLINEWCSKNLTN